MDSLDPPITVGLYRIEVSTYDEVINDPARPALFAAHYDEVCLDKSFKVMHPDDDKFRAIERSGALLTIVARTSEGELVGYSFNVVFPHLHYADLVVAQNDAVFVAQAHRKSRVGLRLIHETERMAKERGAHEMLWHAKQNTALAELMPRLGYRVQDIVFSKEL